MFDDSLNPEHWYFFAVTGINITQKLIKSLMKGEFDEHILRKSEEFKTSESITHLMDYFYFKVFELFNARWRDAKVGIMEFT